MHEPRRRGVGSILLIVASVVRRQHSHARNEANNTVAVRVWTNLAVPSCTNGKSSVVTRTQYTIQEDVCVREMRQIRAGAELVDVRQLAPTQLDTSRFLLIVNEFPVYVDGRK
jgi:hypothetical protein